MKGRMGIGALAVLAACPALALWSPPAEGAERSGAYVVTNRSPEKAATVERVPLRRPQRDGAFVVQRPVVAPDAVVSEALSEQPVRPHRIELVVVHTPITIDPDQRFTRPTGGIDENHSLLRAQRLWQSREAKPARVIRNPYATAPEEQAREGGIVPRAIIHIPDERKRPSPRFEAPPIPSVPAPPRDKDTRQMSLVRSD